MISLILDNLLRTLIDQYIKNVYRILRRTAPVLVLRLVVKVRLALRAEEYASLILGYSEKDAYSLEVCLAVRCKVQKHAGVPREP